jgi:hypothetical protein
MHGGLENIMVKRLRIKFTSNLPHFNRRLNFFCQTWLPEFMCSDCHVLCASKGMARTLCTSKL